VWEVLIMYHKNASRHTSLATWQFFGNETNFYPTNQLNFPHINTWCFSVFMRIKNGLKIRSIYTVREIQRRHQQVQQPSQREIPEFLQPTEIQTYQLCVWCVCVMCVCLCRRTQLGVTALSLTHILCTYFD